MKKNLYWGANWKWANASFKRTAENSGQYGVVGTVPLLKLESSGTIGFAEPNTIETILRFVASEDILDAIGGGWESNFRLDAPSLPANLPAPELLADQAGWTWKIGPKDQAISLRFDKPAAKAYRELNQKNVIRTLFFSDGVRAGSYLFRVTLELPPGASHTLAADERYENSDRNTWFRDALAGDSSPVDLRFLNHDDRPAGSHGFVKVEGDHFVLQDGRHARFWGGNLAANALFSTPRQNVAKQARRMAQLGFNLMRIHHHDSEWVNPNIFDRKFKDSRHLNPTSLESLDWWIKCLKDEGIYVWIDAHVGRTIKMEDPCGDGGPEIKKRRGEFQGFCYFNKDLQSLMIEFQNKYLDHFNKHTQMKYKDDPAVMGVLITNEDDITTHFGNLMLPDKNNPYHNALFTRAYKAFALKNSLAAGRVFQTWLPGPSKLFLNDYEHQFNQTMIQDLRALGVKAPVATTSYWGNESLFSLPALTDGDIIDVHSYGLSEAMSANPRSDPNYLSWIAAGQVYGKPLTITEWNVEYPQVDRFTAPLYLASIAALQGWNAPMIYNYSQLALNNSRSRDTWSTFADPGLTGLMPAAALAYRQEHVSRARKTYCLMLDQAQLFDRALNPLTSATIRTLSEISRLTVGMPKVAELPWLRPSQPTADITVLTDPDRDFIPAGQDFVRSDTRELLRNWKFGIQTVDTPKTQAVSGWIGAKALQLQDATFSFTNKKATVALSSVDDQPLSTSRLILITAMARAVVDPGKPASMLTEPVTGSIWLRTKSKGLQLLALGSDGRVTDRTEPIQRDGTLIVQLPTNRGTHWYLLKSTEPAAKSKGASN